MRALLPLLLLTGCPNSTLDEGPHCEETSTAIGLTDATALGFTAEEVLASIPATQASELEYADGTTTPLALSFAAAADARFVDSEAVYPEGDGMMPAIDVMCEDYIAIDVTFGFATEDGAFAESFDSTIAAFADSTSLNQELDLAALAGTFDLVPFVTAEDYDALKAWISVSFAEGVSTGEVVGQASGEDECEDTSNCTAWAEMVPVGVWPTAE